MRSSTQAKHVQRHRRRHHVGRRRAASSSTSIRRRSSSTSSSSAMPSGPRTRVLMPVHLYGKPTPMAEIVALAEAHGLFVIEDAAQAIGARIEGQVGGDVRPLRLLQLPCRARTSRRPAMAERWWARNAELDEALRRQRELGPRWDRTITSSSASTPSSTRCKRGSSPGNCPASSNGTTIARKAAGWYRERLAGLPLSFQARAEEETHVYHLFQVRTR